MQSSTGAKWKLAPVIISGHLYIFKVLHISKRFYSPSAFIFRVLLFSERFYFPSTFIFRALLFSERFYFSFERFYFNFFFASKCLFFILDASQRLFFILLSMKQCPVFVSKQFLDHISLLFFGLFLNMFQMQFLIMYKTSRFWPLV